MLLLGLTSVFSQTCATESECPNQGVPYCECNEIQKEYCIDGESWWKVDYRCESGNCIAGKSKSSSADYICDNGTSVWNNQNENGVWIGGGDSCFDNKDNDYDGIKDCSDSDCQNACTITEGNTCTSSGSYACKSDNDTQLYCNPSTMKWQFSQYCSSSSRTCDTQTGTCKIICGDNMCGAYESSTDCPGYNDCIPSSTLPNCDYGSQITTGCVCNNIYYTSGVCCYKNNIATWESGGICTTTQCSWYGRNNETNGCWCGSGNYTYDSQHYVILGEYCCGGMKYNTTCCVDSDNGPKNTTDSNISQYLSIKGTCTSARGSWTDQCFTNTGEIYEYFCSGYDCSTLVYKYADYGYNNCTDGAAKNITISNCTEGPIPSIGCKCQSIEKYSGYCCYSYSTNSLVWTNVPCTQTCASKGGYCCSGSASDCAYWSSEWATDCQGYVCCLGTCTGTCYGSNCPDAPPIINSTLNPSTQFAGNSVSLTITITDDNGINSAKWSGDWAFQSGITITCSGKTCNYNTPISTGITGTHTITVNATDTKNQSTINSYSFTINPCSTSIDCGGDNYTGSANCKNNKIVQEKTSGTCSNGVCSHSTWSEWEKEDCVALGKVCSLVNGTATCAQQITALCTASSLSNCTSQSDCSGMGGYWCNNVCQSSACTICSPATLSKCLDQTNCTTVGGYWCSGNCQSSVCPNCSYTQPWNCYNKTDCDKISALWCTDNYGNGWCQLGDCPTYGCSADRAWDCSNKTTCENASGYWCTRSGEYGWCQREQCPKCSKDNYWNCYTEDDCSNASGYWCGTYCQNTKCPSCTTTQPWNCYNTTDCTSASGYWCADVCTTCNPYCSNSQCPSCSLTQVWNCYTETECAGAGGKWCKGQSSTMAGWCSTECPVYTESDCVALGKKWCRPERGGTGWCQESNCPTYSCSTSETGNCKTEKECVNANGYWCGSWCQNTGCPKCALGQEWYCGTEQNCTNVGAKWCKDKNANTWCQSGECPTYICSSTELWHCDTEEKCTNTGGVWCKQSSATGNTGYCNTPPYTCPDYTCTYENYWNCYTEEECDNAGGNWCNNSGTAYKTYNTGWCQREQCPNCSKDNYWNCYTEDDCNNAGGSWCGTYCQNTKCPSCTTTQPWNCYTKTECEKMLGYWCGSSEKGWCSSYSCPTCVSSQVWNCYTEDDCNNAGGNWCGTYCQESKYSCPANIKTGLGVVSKIPEGCKELKDGAVTKVICEEEKKKACPEIDLKWETKCNESGGEVEYKLDENNCKYIDCKVLQKEKRNLWEKHKTCPSADDKKGALQKCEQFNGKAFYEYEGGCEFINCKYEEAKKCPAISELNPKIVTDIKNKCTQEGLIVVEDYDARGCPILKCGSSEKYCKSLPEEAYSNCNGELIVQKDEDGCVTFTDCIAQGEGSIELAVHEKLTQVPDESVLLGVVFTLETLKTKFIELAEKTGLIADFYNERNDSAAQRFERISGILTVAAEKIEKIKKQIGDNLEKLTVEDVEQIKLEIRRLRKNTLKNILYIMLSSHADLADMTEEAVKDCGADEACFKKAYEICKPTIFTPNTGITAKITGLKSKNCVVNITSSNDSMTCSIPTYADGFSNPIEFLPYCEGSLKQIIEEGE